MLTQITLVLHANQDAESANQQQTVQLVWLFPFQMEMAHVHAPTKPTSQFQLMESDIVLVVDPIVLNVLMLLLAQLV